MTGMNCKILFLYEISRVMKSRSDKIIISSSGFGNSLGISQQTASRYLKKLEDEGLIRRMKTGEGQEIQLTSKGYGILDEMYLNLKGFIETKESMEGTVITGIGEGAYYVEKYSEKIEGVLGIKPFLGTLNIKLMEEVINLDRFATGMIDGFNMEGRSFGSIKFAAVNLLLNRKRESCYLIIPQRTHHRDEVEILSEFNLRRRLDLKDGDRVRIELST